MAQRLVAANIQADVVISSPAVRAMTTARYFVEALDMPADGIQQDPEIYEAGLETLLDVVRRTADMYDSAILVGHNPGLTMLNNCLSGTRSAIFQRVAWFIFNSILILGQMWKWEVLSSCSTTTQKLERYPYQGMKNGTKTALVTGGAIRIGKAICMALSKCGYRLILHYSTSEREAESTAKAIESSGGMVDLIHADLVDSNEAVCVVQHAVKLVASWMCWLTTLPSSCQEPCWKQTWRNGTNKWRSM